jgi:hypothetical protein
MIFHTILPNEVVFEDENEQVPNQQMIAINGGQLLVEQESDSECRIVQLISSDPNHFLDPRYQPGVKLPLKPQID